MSSSILSMIGMDRFTPPNSHFQLLVRSLQLVSLFHCTGHIDVQQLQEVFNYIDITSKDKITFNYMYTCFICRVLQAEK